MPVPRATRSLFDAWSRIYDFPAVQWATYRPIHNAVVGTVRGLGARRVLDVGCGTGQLAHRLAETFPDTRVVGCDFSPGMLRKAAARSGDVRWVRGDAGALPFGNGAFDTVVSTEAFHWFPDQDRALAEIFRVLEPGGHLLLALVNTPAAVVSDLFYTGSRWVGEPFYWPTIAQMRQRVEAARFHVVEQRRVFRIPGFLLPPVLTHAVRPPKPRAKRRGATPD